MLQTLLRLLLTGCCLLVVVSGATPDPVFRIRVGLDSRLTAASIVFGPTGNLYVAYRKADQKRKSTAVILKLFDGKTGHELAQSEVATASIQLPQWATAFQLSPDGTLLLYFETPAVLGPANPTRLVAIDSIKLSPASTRDLEETTFPNVRVFGFSADSRSIILGSAEETRLVGESPKTREVRITELDTRDLSASRMERVVENPFNSYSYLIDPNGTPWFSKDDFIPRSFYKYDSGQKHILEGIRVDNQFGLGRTLFLGHGVLSITNEAYESGQVLFFEKQNELPTRTSRVSGCGLKDGVVSPDEVFSVAVCERISQAEATFGNVSVCNLDVFRLSTLQNLTAIPCSKSTTWHPIAVWHGTGQVRVATVDATGTLSLYDIPD